MNQLIILVIFGLITTPIVLNFRQLSANMLHPIYLRMLIPVQECSYNGYYFQKQCYCLEGYEGSQCQNTGFQGYENTPDVCDDYTRRLDHLFNISPDYYDFDDNEFPRLTGSSIRSGLPAYQQPGNTWTKMHRVEKPFYVFNGTLSAKDIGQGALGNCYMLAAIASLANIRGGEPILDAFQTKTDNDKRVYVVRWLIDGKPRFVATDDWVPGVNGSFSFSRVVTNSNFWPIILEKQWAKIHGSYIATTGGWQTSVWKALTQAPIGDIIHSNTNANDLFLLLQSYFAQEFAVGAATGSNIKQDLVQGHAYSVLGTYNVSLGNGTYVRLVKVYNPWGSEKYYYNNPWGDASPLWTDQIKAQVDYLNKNDGQFYLEANDYFQQFGYTNWCEYKRGYGITYQQIQLQNITSPQTFVVRLNNQASFTFYVSVESIDGRLIQGCTSPYRVLSLMVKSPTGKVINGVGEGFESVITAKISGINVEPGDYNVTVSIAVQKYYHDFFTVSVYSAQNSISFYNRTDIYKEKKSKTCPNNCSGKGICNTFSGQCKCNYLYNLTDDCSVKINPVCPSNCSGNGICQDDNTCLCNSGFGGPSCLPCADVFPTPQCLYYKKLNFCTFPKYKSHMSNNCQKTCWFENCQNHNYN